MSSPTSARARSFGSGSGREAVPSAHPRQADAAHAPLPAQHDHRLVPLVQDAGDITIASGLSAQGASDDHQQGKAMHRPRVTREGR